MLPLAMAPEVDHAAQQAVFDAFRQNYNAERPHEALAMDVPADHYRPSLRPLADRLPEPDYPVEAALRRVRSNGEIKWNDDLVYVAAALAGEIVAIEESEAGIWTLRFHAHPLGIIDKKTKRLVRPSALQPRPAGAGADTGLQGGEL